MFFSRIFCFNSSLVSSNFYDPRNSPKKPPSMYTNKPPIEQSSNTTITDKDTLAKNYQAAFDEIESLTKFLDTAEQKLSVIKTEFDKPSTYYISPSPSPTQSPKEKIVTAFAEIDALSHFLGSTSNKITTLKEEFNICLCKNENILDNIENKIMDDINENKNNDIDVGNQIVDNVQFENQRKNSIDVGNKNYDGNFKNTVNDNVNFEPKSNDNLNKINDDVNSELIINNDVVFKNEMSENVIKNQNNPELSTKHENTERSDKGFDTQITKCNILSQRETDDSKHYNTLKDERKLSKNSTSLNRVKSQQRNSNGFNYKYSITSERNRFESKKSKEDIIAKNIKSARNPRKKDVTITKITIKKTDSENSIKKKHCSNNKNKKPADNLDQTFQIESKNNVQHTSKCCPCVDESVSTSRTPFHLLTPKPTDSTFRDNQNITTPPQSPETSESAVTYSELIEIPHTHDISKHKRWKNSNETQTFIEFTTEPKHKQVTTFDNVGQINVDATSDVITPVKKPSKLTVQNMPSVNIKRPLVLQRAPTIEIKAEETIVEKLPIKNIGYVEFTSKDMVDVKNEPRKEINRNVDTTPRNLDTQNQNQINQIDNIDEIIEHLTDDNQISKDKTIDKNTIDEDNKLKELLNEANKIMNEDNENVDIKPKSINEQLHIVDDVPSINTLKTIQKYLENKCAAMDQNFTENRRINYLKDSSNLQDESDINSEPMESISKNTMSEDSSNNKIKNSSMVNDDLLSKNMRAKNRTSSIDEVEEKNNKKCLCTDSSSHNTNIRLSVTSDSTGNINVDGYFQSSKLLLEKMKNLVLNKSTPSTSQSQLSDSKIKELNITDKSTQVSRSIQVPYTIENNSPKNKSKRDKQTSVKTPRPIIQNPKPTHLDDKKTNINTIPSDEVKSKTPSERSRVSFKLLNQSSEYSDEYTEDFEYDLGSDNSAISKSNKDISNPGKIEFVNISTQVSDTKLNNKCGRCQSTCVCPPEKIYLIETTTSFHSSDFDTTKNIERKNDDGKKICSSDKENLRNKHGIIGESKNKSTGMEKNNYKRVDGSNLKDSSTSDSSYGKLQNKYDDTDNSTDEELKNKCSSTNDSKSDEIKKKCSSKISKDLKKKYGDDSKHESMKTNKYVDDSKPVKTKSRYSDEKQICECKNKNKYGNKDESTFSEEKSKSTSSPVESYMKRQSTITESRGYIQDMKNKYGDTNDLIGNKGVTDSSKQKMECKCKKISKTKYESEDDSNLEDTANVPAKGYVSDKNKYGSTDDSNMKCKCRNKTKTNYDSDDDHLQPKYVSDKNESKDEMNRKETINIKDKNKDKVLDDHNVLKKKSDTSDKQNMKKLSGIKCTNPEEAKQSLKDDYLVFGCDCRGNSKIKSSCLNTEDKNKSTETKQKDDLELSWTCECKDKKTESPKDKDTKKDNNVEEPKKYLDESKQKLDEEKLVWECQCKIKSNIKHICERNSDIKNKYGDVNDSKDFIDNSKDSKSTYGDHKRHIDDTKHKSDRSTDSEVSDYDPKHKNMLLDDSKHEYDKEDSKNKHGRSNKCSCHRDDSKRKNNSREESKNKQSSSAILNAHTVDSHKQERSDNSEDNEGDFKNKYDSKHRQADFEKKCNCSDDSEYYKKNKYGGSSSEDHLNDDSENYISKNKPDYSKPKHPSKIKTCLNCKLRKKQQKDKEIQYNSSSESEYNTSNKHKDGLKSKSENDKRIKSGNDNYSVGNVGDFLNKYSVSDDSENGPKYKYGGDSKYGFENDSTYTSEDESKIAEIKQNSIKKNKSTESKGFDKHVRFSAAPLKHSISNVEKPTVNDKNTEPYMTNQEINRNNSELLCVIDMDEYKTGTNNPSTSTLKTPNLSGYTMYLKPRTNAGSDKKCCYCSHQPVTCECGNQSNINDLPQNYIPDLNRYQHHHQKTCECETPPHFSNQNCTDNLNKYERSDYRISEDDINNLRPIVQNLYNYQSESYYHLKIEKTNDNPLVYRKVKSDELSSSTTLTEADVIYTDDACDCTVSLGEVHDCQKSLGEVREKKKRKKSDYYKNHPEELLKRETGDDVVILNKIPNFYNDNVVRYRYAIIPKGNDSDNDTTSQCTLTGSN